MKKVFPIALECFPVLLMMGLIALIWNDYILSVVDVVIILSAFAVKKNKNDLTVFFVGFFVMPIFEYLFVSIGVETFDRNTLFGILPLWLPLLWGYGFVVIKRSTEVLNT